MDILVELLPLSVSGCGVSCETMKVAANKLPGLIGYATNILSFRGGAT
jgi:hypothetical protein